MANEVKSTSQEAMEAEIDFGNAEFVVPGASKAVEDSQESEAGAVQSDKLTSPGIHDDLMKTRITGLSVEETTQYEPNSYLIDTSECEEGMTVQASQALRLLLDPAGTVAVYVSTRTNTFMVGKADAYRAYALLGRMITPLFGEAVKLYYNKDGTLFRQVDSVLLTQVHLDL